jgi:SLT domain-containing protein
MKSDNFQTLTIDELTTCSGGTVAMDPAAKWIMQHESGGSPTAGHLHSQGRGDGTRGNQSSAFGAFQMIQSTRKQYMGKDYQSTDLGKQYAAATKYVDQRYGSWGKAESFWKSHHWY